MMLNNRKIDQAVLRLLIKNASKAIGEVDDIDHEFYAGDGRNINIDELHAKKAAASAAVALLRQVKQDA